MPEWSKFRLGDVTLGQLDDLAASAGNRAQAIREAVCYWRRAVEDAGAANAAEFTRDEWHLLAHLNQPDDLLPTELRDDSERAAAHGWGPRLAVELAGAWEGRAVVLPEHRKERAACRKLASRVGALDLTRGYAMFACLRYFWGHPGVGDGVWWDPAVWLVAETPAK